MTPTPEIKLADILTQYNGNKDNYSIREAYERATKESKNKIVAVDVDDVLFNTAAVALRQMDSNRSYLEDFFDLSNLPERPSDTFCYSRKDYYLTNIFPMRPDVDPDAANRVYIDNTWKYPFLYYSVLPMRMTRILQFALDTLPDYISKIYVISECIKGTINDKTNAVNRVFGDYKNKVEFLYSIAGEYTKSDILNYYNIDFDIYIEDKISNIVDMIINHKGTANKEILIPAYGYNTQLSDLEKAVFKESNCSIYYYEDNLLNLDLKKK